MSHCRMHMMRGFTLLEMLLTITILATLAAVAIPMVAGTDVVRVRAATDLLISDIELAQILNISYPNDPVVVRFDVEANEYWLAYASSPGTPLNREDTGEPYLVQMGIGRASAAEGVVLNVLSMTNNEIAFNPQGGLTDFSATPVIQLTLAGEAIAITIAPTTGTIFETAVEDVTEDTETESKSR